MKNTLLGLSILLLLSCDNAEKENSVAANKKDKKEVQLFKERSSSETNLKFKNTVQETETENYSNYPFIYNGSGVAVGDINNDGLADIYFSGNSSEDKLYLNEGNLKFKDISASSGIEAYPGWSMGVNMIDINNDGWLDIYVSRAGPSDNVTSRTNRLFVNQQDGTFKEEAATFGISNMDHSIQSAFFDYDLDGDLDMYQLNHPAKKRPQSLTFTTHQENVKSGKSITDRFYENVDGQFVDKTKEANLYNYGYRHGIAIGDVNKDGYPDLYISSDFDDADLLYINQKNKSFKNTIDQSMGHISFNSMGNELVDINNDQQLDLYVVDMAPSDHFRSKAYMASMDVARFHSLVNNGMHHQYMFNTFQLNNGNSSFSEVGQLSGTAKTDWSWAPLFFDMDHDGYKDLFVTNGIKENFLYRDIDRDAEEKYGSKDNLNLQQILDVIPSDISENIFYRNKNGVKFENKSGSWAPRSLHNSNGIATADFDNDGDMDFVINNMDSDAVLYESLASDEAIGNSIKIKLKGASVNPSAIGAKVEVVADDLNQWQELYTTRGYLSSVDSPLIFGLSDAENATVNVTWPDGKISSLKNVAANGTYEIDYADATTGSFNKNSNNKKWLSRANETNIAFNHKEDRMDDYKIQILLPHSQSNVGPSITKGDVNGDSLEDFYIGGAAGQGGALYVQQTNGTFTTQAGPWSRHAAAEDTGGVFFDADTDGDLDLYVTSGGAQKEEGHFFYTDRLYINDGKGNFNFAANNIPKTAVSGKAVVASDIDADGDMDLFVGGRLVPDKYPMAPQSYFLINDGGKFTQRNLNVDRLVADALFSDYDNDGDEDLMTVGEWSEVMVFNNEGGNFTKADIPSLADTNGLWFSINGHDIDGDGDQDYFVGNLGLNAKFKVDATHEFHIYGNDFDDNGTYDIVLSGNYQGKLVPSRGRECSSQQMPFIKEKFTDFSSFASASLEDIYGEKLTSALHYQADMLSSVFLRNDGNGEFEIVVLPWQAQQAPLQDANFVDINGDGVTEILAVGNLYNVEVETQRYDASQGTVLAYRDGNFEVLPASQTGFVTSGDARNITTLKSGQNTLILVANNNGRMDIMSMPSAMSNAVSSR